MLNARISEFDQNAGAVIHFARTKIREPVAGIALAGGGIGAATNTASGRTGVAARRSHAA